MAATVHDLYGDAPPAPDFTRNIEAEQCLIGAALAAANRGNRDVLADLRAPLLTEAFAVPEHREVWRAMCALHAVGAPITIQTVMDHIGRHAPGFGSGPSALNDWTERVHEYFAAPALARHYADQVQEAAARRTTIAIAREWAEAAKSDHRAPHEWAPGFAAQMAAVRVVREAELTFSQSVAETLTILEQRAAGTGPVGIPTGLRDLDERMGGLYPSRYVVIAGRTSMGKSAFALTVARHILRRGVGVGVLSFEMSTFELTQRLIAQESGVALSRLSGRWRRPTDAGHISDAAAEVATWPLQIHDGDADWPVAETQIRRLVANGARVIVVDHLGLVHVSMGKGASRWEQVGAASKAIKRLARQLDVTIIALAQINREVGQSKDRRPQLWMLRDSGSIEEDADEVLLLHRPGYYEPTASDDTCECVVSKDRHGPTGKVNLAWHKELAMFGDTQGAFDDQPEADGGWR